MTAVTVDAPRRLDLVPLAFAVILIGYAVQIQDGFYTSTAMALIMAAIAAALVSFSTMTPVSPVSTGTTMTAQRDERVVTTLLAAGLASNFVLMLLKPVGMYIPRPWATDHPLLIVLLVIAAICVVQIVREPERAWRVWFPALLVTFAAMGVWMIKASPKPHIDVITVHQVAISALRAGQNPYAVSFPNIYGSGDNYPPELVHGQWVMFGLPYPPLSLLMAAPGQLLLGDIRYAELISLIAGAAGIGYASRSIIAPLAAASLLLTPRGLFVLEQGWTEPFAICWIGASVYAARRAPRALPWTLALLISAKQHLVLALPFALLLLPRPFDWRSAVRFLLPPLLVPLAIAAPFILWNATAFMTSVFWVQLAEPFKPLSLSVLRYLSDQGRELERGDPLLIALPLLAMGVSLVAGWWRAPRNAAGFGASLGLILLLVTATSKKAFCNYYFLVIAAFCAAIAAAAGRTESPETQARDSNVTA